MNAEVTDGGLGITTKGWMYVLKRGWRIYQSCHWVELTHGLGRVGSTLLSVHYEQIVTQTHANSMT